jgi:hypothetical protein
LVQFILEEIIVELPEDKVENEKEDEVAIPILTET